MIGRNEEISVLLRADKIPHLAKVTKPSGSKVYTFRRNLRVFLEEGTADSRQTIDGFFLVFEGDINQIGPDSKLMWLVKAGDLMDILERQWEDDVTHA